MKRVLLVTNIPNPYRIPLFNELNRQLGRRGVRLKVLFAALGYRRRKWKLDMAQCRFDYDVLSSQTFEVEGDAEKTMFTYGGLLRHVRACRPDVVVVAGFSLATARLWLGSWIRPLPYIIWTGSIGGVWTNRAGARTPRSLLRTLMRKVLARRAAGFVAYGSKARAYLIGLGAPPQAVRIGINTVDTQFFAQATQRLREQGRNGSSKGGEKQRLTCIGYLSARKGNLKLLEAVRKVARQRTDFVLDVVGEGEDRPRLEAFVRDHKLSGHVHFHGYRQKEELPAFLAQSRCLLYATNYDIWGLVLVEAMAARLPVIASVHAGATHDLVQEGATGFVVDFADTDHAADRINWVLDHPEQAAAMGRRARAFVAEHATVEKSAAGFVEAILDVLGREGAAAGGPMAAAPAPQPG